ncbi:DUF4340 domain-containing protein [Lacrimispora xylanisolvens]|uniref:DUF4340 domain-containing protein n=1 Tax=Lacrimispora xylanisolvens TaxID=384636 RepID=UPI0024026E05
MKKKNGLIFGAAALVVLCAVYVGVGQYMDRSQKKTENQKEASKVYMTDFSEIQSVSYDREGNEISFTKKDGKWVYDQDVKFPVMQTKMDGIASTVSKLEAVRKLEDGDGFGAYGLDQPIRTITVTGADNKKSVILLGNATPDGDYYAAIQGEDTPYLIGSSLYTETDSGLNDFMALEEFPAIAGTDITGITVTKGDNRKQFVKKKLDDEKGTIEWYKDSADTAENKVDDNSPLNVLADSLAGLKVKSCPNYNVTDSQLKDYGLDQPSAVISYTYNKNGKDETFQLSVGSLNEDSSCYYTRTENSPFVNEIDKASVDKCLTVNEEISK